MKVERSASLRELTLREVQDEAEKLRAALNSIGPQNMDWEVEEVTTPATPDEEFAVSHDLERVPTLWIANPVDKAATLYDGTTDWTAEEIYLRCDVATALVRIIIL